MAHERKQVVGTSFKDMANLDLSSDTAHTETEQSTYSEDDYFEAHTGHRPRRILKMGIVTTQAENIAKKIGNDHPNMTSHQLRRFFSHARMLERRLQFSESDFQDVRSDIERLITFAVDASGKRKIPRSFEQFIRANVTLALQSREHFLRGFLPHFEAVVAYFTYHFPRK